MTQEELNTLMEPYIKEAYQRITWLKEHSPTDYQSLIMVLVWLENCEKTIKDLFKN